MIGEVVGSFRVEREIGRGGMGVVYLARHVEIGRRAAIKVLRPDVAKDPDMVQRFFAEARAAGRLEHPGLVEVFDLGRRDDGSAYLVMPYLEGETLAERLRRGALAPEVALPLGQQIVDALGAAHGRGIVHRDLKPENLFLQADDALGLRVKVLDFGVAKLIEREPGAPAATGGGHAIGTPFYMAPEQCRGAEVDARADIYALGCVLFEMVCGRVPFTGTSTADVMGAHVHLPPPPPRELAPGLPRELERLILRMLAKERAERPADMAAVGRILDRLHGGPRGYVQPAATAHGRTDRMAPETAPTVDAKPLARPGTESTLRATAVEVKRPSRAVGVKSPLLAAGGLATLAVAAWLGWQRWGRGAPAELRGDEGAAIAASAALAAVPAPQPQPESQPARAPASPAPEPTALPAPAPVRVDLRSTPAGAAILNGGVSLGVTPRVIELPRGAAAVELRLELAGFRPALLRVTPDRDQRFDERLLPARRPAGTRMGDGVYQPFK